MKDEPFESATNSKRVHTTLQKNLQPDETGGTLTDVGSGDGKLIQLLKPLYKKTIAIDHTPHPNTKADQIIQSDFNFTINLPDQTSDTTISTSTIEHLENPYHFLRELNRITKNGGTIIVSTHKINNLYGRLVFLKNGWLNGYKFPQDATSKGSKGRGHHTPLTQEQLQYAGERTGLQHHRTFTDPQNKDYFVVFKKPKLQQKNKAIIWV